MNSRARRSEVRGQRKTKTNLWPLTSDLWLMEISLLLTLDLREQAALQAALVTHGAPDCLVTLALTGACRISTLEEARRLRRWLAEARAAGQTDFISLNSIERALIRFGV